MKTVMRSAICRPFYLLQSSKESISRSFFFLNIFEEAVAEAGKPETRNQHLLTRLSVLLVKYVDGFKAIQSCWWLVVGAE